MQQRIQRSEAKVFILGFLLCMFVVMWRTEDKGLWGRGKKEDKFSLCVFSLGETVPWNLLDDTVVTAQSQANSLQMEMLQKVLERKWYHLFARNHLLFEKKAKITALLLTRCWMIFPLWRIWKHNLKENRCLMICQGLPTK